MSRDFSKTIIIVHNVHRKLMMAIPCSEGICYYVVVCIKGRLNLMVVIMVVS